MKTVLRSISRQTRAASKPGPPLAGTRPLVCRLSGSGSALVAVYRNARDREDARMMLGRKHGGVHAVETLDAPVPVETP